MGKNKRVFTAEFKAKVVQEALRDELTLNELGSKYEILPAQISEWKRQAFESLVEGFRRKNAAGDKKEKKKQDHMLKVIAELKLENEWMKKKFPGLALLKDCPY